MGRRQNESWDGDAIPKAEQVETVGENVIGNILKEMDEMGKTNKGDGMFSVSIPEAVLPQFQMLMELVRLRKQFVDVGNHLAGNRENTGQDKKFMRQVQEGATKVCGTGSVDDVYP